MNVGSALIANPQAAELMKPAERAFHNRSEFAKTATVGLSALGDARLDSAMPEQDAVHFRVVGPIRIEAFGAPDGCPRLPRMAGMASTKAISWVTSCRFAPVSREASGVPLASVMR